MYTRFFQLTQAPFSIAPDPHYLFMSERHREALAHLLYGVNSGGGFVLLTGEVGAGKTTVCRCFLEQIPSDCNVAYIFNPKLTVAELLQAICDEFGVQVTASAGQEGPPGMKDRIDALNRFLLVAHSQGCSNVLIIDEAQNLSAEVLEQLRLLTNLETSQRKLLQIMLIGQPQLQALLAQPELEQLAQRIIARYHLGALSEEDTGRYIRHRLEVAGLEADSPFPAAVVGQVYRLSNGVPRRINLLCDRALLGAYAQNRKTVEPAILEQAADEVFGTRSPGPGRTARRRRAAAWGLAGTGALAAAIWTVVPGEGLPAWRLPFSASGGATAATPASAPPRPAAAVAVAASVPAAPAAPPAASVSQDPQVPLRDPEQAYRQLARLWGVQAEEMEGKGICAEEAGLPVLCYHGTQGLAEIRQLERPAILTLLDDKGEAYFALLSGLTNASATLHVGGSRHTISLLELDRRFAGQFVTLWRAQPGQRQTLREGDQGADVGRLARQLGQLSRDAQLAGSEGFDARLAMAVREFQRAQGLAADGIVGPKTLMHLNSASGVEEPGLHGSAAVQADQVEE